MFSSGKLCKTGSNVGYQISKTVEFCVFASGIALFFFWVGGDSSLNPRSHRRHRCWTLLSSPLITTVHLWEGRSSVKWHLSCREGRWFLAFATNIAPQTCRAQCRTSPVTAAVQKWHVLPRVTVSIRRIRSTRRAWTTRSRTRNSRHPQSPRVDSRRAWADVVVVIVKHAMSPAAVAWSVQRRTHIRVFWPHRFQSYTPPPVPGALCSRLSVRLWMRVQVRARAWVFPTALPSTSSLVLLGAYIAGSDWKPQKTTCASYVLNYDAKLYVKMLLAWHRFLKTCHQRRKIQQLKQF